LLISSSANLRAGMCTSSVTISGQPLHIARGAHQAGPNKFLGFRHYESARP
jgi:hypothetical protein